MKIIRIDYRPNAKSFLCCRLALLGFSASLISQRTGLSNGQIYYRLRQSGVHIKDYRDGRGTVAKYVVETTERKTIQELQNRLRPLLQQKGRL